MNRFEIKDSKILKARIKVNMHLEYLKGKYSGRDSMLTLEEKQEVSVWNDWHDLGDRLEMRQRENLSDFHSWEFETKGFTAIAYTR